MEEKCRACLSSTNLIPFTNESLINYNEVSNLSVEADDGLPQTLCEDCQQSVVMFVGFRFKCSQTEIMLKNLILKKEELDGNIKMEVEELLEQSVNGDIDNGELKFEMDGDHQQDGVSDDETVFDIKLEVPEKKTRNSRKPKTSSKTKAIKETKIKVSKKTYKKRKKEEKIATPKKEYFCGICPKKMRTKESITAHIEGHKTCLTCLNCKETFPIWEKLLTHRSKHLDHGPMCHLCFRKYAVEASLECHYIVDHLEKGRDNWTCTTCYKSFQTRRKLMKHLHQHRDKEFECDYCGDRFVTKFQVQMHITTHTGLKQYTCKLCSMEFQYYHALVKHLSRDHHDKPQYCTRCKFHFADQRKLETHKCVSPCICPTCGKVYGTKKAYERHQVVHTGVRKYACDVCPAAFKSRGAYAVHKNRHNDVRPYTCKYCPKAFYSMSVLIKHTRIHTGEKPYVCKICSKGFTGGNNLKVHMRVHGEFLVQSKKDLLLQEEPIS